MQKSTFHKLIFMMVFETDFTPPIVYSNAWDDWLDDAAGQLRCISVKWYLEDIDFENKEIIIRYSGERAHDGNSCNGIIYSDFDGNVMDVR